MPWATIPCESLFQAHTTLTQTVCDEIHIARTGILGYAWTDAVKEPVIGNSNGLAVSMVNLSVVDVHGNDLNKEGSFEVEGNSKN